MHIKIKQIIQRESVIRSMNSLMSQQRKRKYCQILQIRKKGSVQIRENLRAKNLPQQLSAPIILLGLKRQKENAPIFYRLARKHLCKSEKI